MYHLRVLFNIPLIFAERNNFFAFRKKYSKKILTFNLHSAKIALCTGGDTMLNTSAINSRMRELGVTQSELAGAVRMATPTICQKLNNIRPTTLEEAEKIAVKLKIADSEFGHYFFYR